MSAEQLDMLPEQAADWRALQAAAAEQDAEQAMQDGGGESVEVGPDAVAETAAAFGAAVALLSPMLPYLPAIYTQERVEQLAGAYVPVAEKYGWSAGGWLERFGAEIALVAVAGPMVVQTVGAHKAHRAAVLRAKRDAEREARPAISEQAPGIVAGTVQAPDVAPTVAPGAVAFSAVAA